MSILNDLINQIEDAALKERIAAEVEKLAKQKKFGLVFEEHLPECTPLYDIPVKVGAKVALKRGEVNDFYVVAEIKDGKAVCLKKGAEQPFTFDVNELVTIAEFGESIYPYLKPIDSVCNAPDSELWHTLIEADNYHALQLLEYLYAGKVDCIYIDPPYNTGARDWKYNNDYVDATDQYRHSKWLSMMQKRLKIAKKILKPDGVLICAIDDNELNGLGLLLQELFSEKKVSPIVVVHNPSGTQGNNFSYNNEFLYFVYNPNIISILPELRSDDTADIRPFMNGAKGKSGNYLRSSGATTFYPIIVKNNNIIGFGNVPVDSFHPEKRVLFKNDSYYIYPIDNDNVERKWLFGRETVDTIKQELFVKLDKDGLPVIYRKKNRINRKTVWISPSFSAKQYGSSLINSIILNHNFSFPKSLYAVKEAIVSCVENKPNALIVDFFAGSGTTLHAVNLLNAEDGGKRRCILVTNNEVSDSEAKEMTERGLHPGDEEWERLGIARYVTWPRTVCSIEGRDVNGNPLKGNYLGSDIPMADGFKANAAYFKLGFLDKGEVALGNQFKELLSTLWMKAGAIGKCPTLENDVDDMLILPENKFAVLIDESKYIDFIERIDEHPEIETIFIVTDSEKGYREMISFLDGKTTYQLYKDYLDNFRINCVRR